MTVNSLYGGNDSEETGSMHSTSCGGQSSLKPFESTADVHQMKTHVSSTVRLPIKNLNKLNHTVMWKIIPNTNKGADLKQMSMSTAIIIYYTIRCSDV